MINEFNRICEFRKNNPGVRGSGLSVKDPILAPVVKDIKSIQQLLQQKFWNYRGLEFQVEISKGQTYFPSIIHVSILPPAQKVSKGIYVVMCFDILGRGALVGCIESVTNPQGLSTVKRKSPKQKLAIDVNGLRVTTKYNNAFENPREFFAGLSSDSALLNHINISLDLALYHLGLYDSPNLNINRRVAADKHGLDFDPTNISDGREKIARYINARRGQKKFRNSLLRAYKSKCAVTGCALEPILEAAHISPYRGDHTNHVQNGLLLRSDIHLLFDLGLLTIDYETKQVILHDSLDDPYYTKYQGKLMNLPQDIKDHPHTDSLKWHNEKEFGRDR